VSNAPDPGNPPSHGVRALVVDRHEATRIGHAILLRRQPWITRCVTARDHHEATALARRHRPDVALLDISDMGPFVASVTATLRAAHPALQIVLTTRCSARMAPPDDAGATALLSSDSSGADVVAAVRAAALSPQPLARPPSRQPHAGLTPREREVLALLATGATNREIAARLHLAPDSIKKHAAAVYRKLGVRNRTQATQLAISLFT
jgi:DNA-binding NarL/FixJ family response regulator